MSVCDYDLLSSHVDGALTLPARLELETHVRDCAGCQVELAALQRIDRVLSVWADTQTPMPRETRRRIVDSVERKRRLGRIGKVANIMPAAFGSSIAVLLVLAGVHSGALYQTPSAASNASAQPVASRSMPAQSAAVIRSRRTSAILADISSDEPDPLTVARRLTVVN